MKISSYLFGIISMCLLISCGGSDCYTCTPLDGTGDSLEICDDPELFYTDIDGNMISFDQFLSNAEDLGFDCEN